MGLKEFKVQVAEELESQKAKEQDPARKEKLRKAALWGATTGAIIWGGFAVAAAIMLISMGAWAWVVWPFAFYWYIGYLGRVVKAYKAMVKPQKWEQNIVINVTEPTAESISLAAEKAVNERLAYDLR